MQKCNKCGAPVPPGLPGCPVCSNRKEKSKTDRGVIIGIAIAVVFVFLIFASPGQQQASSPTSRQGRIDAQFNSWTGAHIPTERLIKESMHDPSSYEHVETVYWDQNNQLIIRTTFRGTNAFGATVKNWIKVKASISGSILEILEQGP